MLKRLGIVLWVTVRFVTSARTTSNGYEAMAATLAPRGRSLAQFAWFNLPSAVFQCSHGNNTPMAQTNLWIFWTGRGAGHRFFAIERAVHRHQELTAISIIWHTKQRRQRELLSSRCRAHAPQLLWRSLQFSNQLFKSAKFYLRLAIENVVEEKTDCKWLFLEHLEILWCFVMSPINQWVHLCWINLEVQLQSHLILASSFSTK